MTSSGLATAATEWTPLEDAVSDSGSAIEVPWPSSGVGTAASGAGTPALALNSPE